MIDYIGSLSPLGYSGDTPEGGEEPWWDATSLVDIDFINDRAWTAADGEVAITTLVGEDPQSDLDGTTTAWVPGALTADGYATNTKLAFIGAAKSALLA